MVSRPGKPAKAFSAVFSANVCGAVCLYVCGAVCLYVWCCVYMCVCGAVCVYVCGDVCL